MNYTEKVEAVSQRLAEIKIVPVLAVSRAESAGKLAEVLTENGLPCAEVTFRTEAAFEVLKAMRASSPNMVLGAGTVLTKEQVDLAIEAGVDFAVSPGFNPETVAYAMSKGLPFLPGVNNPSLVEHAMAMGLTTLKFFPATVSGGTDMLKALQAVYPVKFMPTGGINPENAHNFLALNKVFCCGGTWMVPQGLVDAEDWDALAALTKEAAELVAS
jgi:2-dehydro-3-deoxyphosphogluconate aldolase/(4S)-4-hydroxy-2-oxoglutarate aldolase